MSAHKYLTFEMKTGSSLSNRHVTHLFMHQKEKGNYRSYGTTLLLLPGKTTLDIRVLIKKKKRKRKRKKNSSVN